MNKKVLSTLIFTHLLLLAKSGYANWSENIQVDSNLIKEKLKMIYPNLDTMELSTRSGEILNLANLSDLSQITDPKEQDSLANSVKELKEVIGFPLQQNKLMEVNPTTFPDPGFELFLNNEEIRLKKLKKDLNLQRMKEFLTGHGVEMKVISGNNMKLSTQEDVLTH